MLLARSLQRRAAALRSGAPGQRRAHGEARSEAIAVGTAAALEPEDRLFAPERYLAAHLARGLSADHYLCSCIGGESRAPGPRGAIGFACSGAELVDLAAGAALALQVRHARAAAVAIVPGDAFAGGSCDQALAAARSRRLPLALVVDRDPSGLAQDGEEDVDAFDVEAVSLAVRRVLKRARDEGGPSIVQCRETVEADGDRDPIRRELKRLARNPNTRELLTRLRDEVAKEVGAADRAARSLRTRRRRSEAGLGVAA